MALTLTSALKMVAFAELEAGLLQHSLVLRLRFLVAYTELLREAPQLGFQPSALDPLSDLLSFTQHLVEFDAILLSDALRLDQGSLLLGYCATAVRVRPARFALPLAATFALARGLLAVPVLAVDLVFEAAFFGFRAAFTFFFPKSFGRISGAAYISEPPTFSLRSLQGPSR